MSRTNGTPRPFAAAADPMALISAKLRKQKLAKYEVWWNGGKIWTFEAPPDVDPTAVVQKTIPWRQEELEIRRIA